MLLILVNRPGQLTIINASPNPYIVTQTIILALFKNLYQIIQLPSHSFLLPAKMTISSGLAIYGTSQIQAINDPCWRHIHVFANYPGTLLVRYFSCPFSIN